MNGFTDCTKQPPLEILSSDGSGGMTRPEVEGQLLALRRAYRRAGFGPDDLPVVRAFDLKLMINSLPSQTGSVIEQAFRCGAFWRTDDAGDFHDLSAEKIGA